MLRNALDAACRGWSVFPVIPGGKAPAVKAWEQRATTDPARIRRCWSTGPYNIGIACGPSNLAVIDLDKPKAGKEIPPSEWRIPGIGDGFDVFAEICGRAGQPVPFDTYTVTTASGGSHLYFEHPDGPHLRNTTGSLGWLIDTRAHGGYVLAAGSIVNGNGFSSTPPRRSPTKTSA